MYGFACARHELVQKHMLNLGCSVISVLLAYKPRIQVKWPAMAAMKWGLVKTVAFELSSIIHILWFQAITQIRKKSQKSLYLFNKRLVLLLVYLEKLNIVEELLEPLWLSIHCSAGFLAK